MARTRHQQPKLKKDAGNQRFEARYREDQVQKDGTIKRVRPKVFFPFDQYPTLKLAQKALDEILNPINKPNYQPRRMATFREFVATWEKTIMVHHALTTQAGEKLHLKNYLLPAFGDRQIGTIDTEAVQAWVSSPTAQKLDPVYLDHIYATLRNILRIAKRDKYIETNPCCPDIVLPPKPEKGLGTYAYTIADFQAMKAHMSEQNRLIFRVQGETGIRPGEVAALKVDCLSLNEAGIPILTVKENYVDIDGGSFKPPKNGKVRFFPLSAALYQELCRFLANKNRTEGLIFHNRNGKPLDKGNFNRMLRGVAAKSGILARVQAMGIKKLGTYPLRRLVSTEADGEHLPEKTRSERMGHTPDMFTVYAKRIEEADVRFANALAAKLDGSPLTSPGSPATTPASDLAALAEQFSRLDPQSQAAFIDVFSRVQNPSFPGSKTPFPGVQNPISGVQNASNKPQNEDKTAAKRSTSNDLGLFWTHNGPKDGLSN